MDSGVSEGSKRTRIFPSPADQKLCEIPLNFPAGFWIGILIDQVMIQRSLIAAGHGDFENIGKDT